MGLAYVAGIAPRSATYMRAHWDHAKSFLDDEGLEAAREAERLRWVDAQREAGLDLVGPGYVETEDILRPLTSLPGAAAGPLTRTFETNTFHRRPTIREPVPEQGLRPWVDRVALDRAWVLSLPSPYDAVARSDGTQDAAVQASIAACLRDAAAYALHHGAVRVRFQEPSAVYRGHGIDLERFSDLVAQATHGIEEQAVVHFTQGDPLAVPGLVDAVACRGIGLDVSEIAAAPAGTLEGKQLHAGVIQGQSSLVERAGAQAAVALAQTTGAQLYALTNGWDLEHVPFDAAVAKLRVLAASRAVEVVA